VANASVLVADNGALGAPVASPATGVDAGATLPQAPRLGKGEWIKLDIHGSCTLEMTDGGVLQNVEGEIPSIQLAKSGTRIVWQEEDVPCMLAVALQRSDTPGSRQASVLSTRSLTRASALVQGLRLQLHPGVIADLSHFAVDLFGLHSFGQDLALMVSEIMRAAALSNLNEASLPAPLDLTGEGTLPGTQDPAHRRDRGGVKPQGENGKQQSARQRRQSAFGTLSTALSHVSTGVGVGVSTGVGVGEDTTFSSLSSAVSHENGAADASSLEAESPRGRVRGREQANAPVRRASLAAWRCARWLPKDFNVGPRHAWHAVLVEFVCVAV
jgi:hypothetical protein